MAYVAPLTGIVNKNQQITFYLYTVYNTQSLSVLVDLICQKIISHTMPKTYMHGYTILLILLLVPMGQSLDYDKQHSLNCSQISDTDTKLEDSLPLVWDKLILHTIDRIFFLAACPVILLAQVVVLVNYYKYPQLLAKPGNIFCGLVFIQMCLNSHLFINSIYRSIYPDKLPMPGSFIPFCISMGFYSSFFSLLHFMYLIMFMFYTIFLFRFSLKKKSKVFWAMLHAFVLIASAGLTIFFYLQEFMGLNFYGLCGLTSIRRLSKNLALPIMELLCSFIFLILGIFTFIYFKKHMPGGERFRKRKIEEGKIIFMYVTGFSFFDIVMSVMTLILDLNCTTQIPGIYVLVTITNIIRLLQFCFLIFLIMYNEKFRKKFKHTLKSLWQRRKLPRASSIDILKTIEMEDVFFNEKLLEMKEISNEIDLLLLSQVYTIISGVYIAYYEYFRSGRRLEQLRRINYRESISFSIDNKSIMGYETEARLLVKLKILPCSIIIHCPEVFHQLLAQDGLNDVFESFKIVDNSAKLSNLAEGKGGKSGEFFFFSADNKYVIKTITIEEFQFYNENLETFHEYYLDNPSSLLAKILGLITIKGDEMQRTYHLILMKNILGCQRNQIIRMYDLKGSKYDRQVLFQQVQINQVSKMTLKDVDFINYEHSLKINSKTGDDLRESLRKDTKFLKSLNLLDYSLLIVRVKWNSPPEQQRFWGPLQRIPHQSARNQFYHIGVIDYMQKWDFQKKSERWWKTFTGKKDVSAQEPSRYQTRFMEFVDQITQFGVKARSVKDIKTQQFEMKEIRSVTEPNKQMNIEQSLKKQKDTKERTTNNI